MSYRSAAMAQVNVRMSPALKEAGDATLARVDVSPAQLVRAVWAKIACGAEAFDQLVATLLEKPSAAAFATDADGSDSLDIMFAQTDAFYAQMAAQFGPAPAPLTADEWEDALYDDYLEREQERVAHHAD